MAKGFGRGASKNFQSQLQLQAPDLATLPAWRASTKQRVSPRRCFASMPTFDVLDNA